MNKSNMVEINNESVEFNVFNIMAGKFGGSKGGTRTAKFKMYASLRLLTESGFVPSDAQSNVLSNMAYKWYYYKLNNGDTTGTIIVGLHKKDINLWTYVSISTDGELKSFNTIQDAKANI